MTELAWIDPGMQKNTEYLHQMAGRFHTLKVTRIGLPGQRMHYHVFFAVISTLAINTTACRT